MKQYFLDLTLVPDAELEQWYFQMQRSRQDRCKRMKNREGQKQCIAADHLARTALSEHLNRPAEEIQIEVSPEGKPYILGNPVYFSVSHSGNRIACAASKFPVGIDIEYIRPIPKRAQERICTQNEWNYLISANDEADRNLRFLYLWTRKEAVFKVDGRLPRRDSETDVLTFPEGWTAETRTEDGFIISVAIRQKL